MIEPEETSQPAFEQSDYFNDGLCNFIAGAAPTVNDDAADGYQPGSVWYKAAVPYGLWKCVDATEGAAVWVRDLLYDTLFASQLQNLVFASPNGSSGLPSFRALVANDITSGVFAAARLGSGATSSNFLRGDQTYANPLTVGAVVAGGGANRVLYQDGSQNLAASPGLTYDGAKLGIGSSQISSPAGTVFFAGNFAGSNRVSGSNQVGIGEFALNGALTGNNNFGIGSYAGAQITSGAANVLVGTNAGYSLVTASENMFLGSSAGYFITGDANSFIGANAGQGASGATAARNVGIGKTSLYSVSSGNENVGLGNGTLQSLTTGSTNNALGYQAGFSLTTASGNVFIGHQAGYSETGSNKLYIANSNTSTPLIYGEFDNELVRVNGDLEVTEYIRSAKFKDYMAAMSQTGTSAPTAAIIDNSLGAVVWTRNSAGNYSGTLTGAFGTIDKCFFTPKWAYYPEDDQLIKITYGNANSILLESEEALTGTDGLLVSFPIHIRVSQ